VSLETRVSLLATRIADECQALAGQIALKAPINNPTFTGTVSGNGSGLTALNASNLGSGTVPYVRLPEVDLDGRYNRKYYLAANGGTPQFVHIATLNGASGVNGAAATFLISGQGNYANLGRGTTTVHMTQRGSNVISATAWTVGSPTNPWTFSTRQVSEFVFELWGYRNVYDAATTVHVLTAGGQVTMAMTQTVTDPGSRVAATMQTIQSAEDLDARYVNMTGAETIDGEKTFSSEIVGGGGLTGNVLRVGNDSRLVDVNEAHTMAVVSTTDAGRGQIRFGSGFRIMGDAGVGTISGITNFQNTVKMNGVGSNLRIQGGNTDALDGGVFADLPGNVYFSNWSATRGLRVNAAGGVDVLGGFALSAAVLSGTQAITGAYHYVDAQGDNLAMSTVHTGATETVPHYGMGKFTWDDGSGVAGANASLSGYFGLSLITNGIPRIRIQRAGQVQFPYGDLLLSHATRNQISFSQNGVAAPTFTTRSVGTKAVWYTGLTASAVDYATGIEGSTLWHSVPQATSSYFHRWYAGTTQLMSMRGDGVFTVYGSITATTAIYGDYFSMVGARSSIRYDNTGTDWSNMGLDIQNNTGHPGVVLHVPSVMAKTLRLHRTSGEFEFVNQGGTALTAVRGLLNAADLNTGTVPDARLPITIVEYTTTVPARPASGTVIWQGQVDPAANALAGDQWWPTP
jgi:hypothetical protein